ncbi:hypothetical protein [Sulfobacillus harzensis]|uniref:Segregation and condensation protein A n=1 Tax=Sulfobacillus harzensis TaxID=2729629 RepID=A0A7Y0L5T1_9FIRM|nr:hypothetical protein [Sulfobacillus harzensis]NMP22434.1 hypothetical protein [Sulfobacillus harzensis]
MASEEGLGLYALADRIRRHPELARELQVSALAQEVGEHWREHSDMLAISEEMPVAAWIVKKKVEGLIRPEEPQVEEPGFDLSLRPPWLDEALWVLQEQVQRAAARWDRPGQEIVRPAAPVKDSSPWKLSWAYPNVRPKPVPPERRVAREVEPLSDHIRSLSEAVARLGRVNLQASLADRPRPEWVARFLAAVHLWHTRAVEVEQSAAFAPIHLTPGGERREFGPS